MHVHWWEQWDVEQHSDADEDWKAEGGVELVREVDAEDIVLVSV